jgi:arylsulfatase A-like enzyme
VRLSRHYTYMYCSPTRRSFLSGRFPVHISEGQADACSNYLPLNFTLLSAKLAQAGYVSHFIGKGHLGYQTTDHLPINRGFSSHVGYLAAWESYQYGNNMGCGKNASEATCLRKDFWHDHQPGEDVVDEINYSSNYYTKRAVALIQNSTAETPLWIHLAYQAVHSPYTNPPVWNLTDSSAFCGGICRGCHPGNGGCAPESRNCDVSACHVFGDMLSVVDSGVGNVTDSLHSTGRYEGSFILVSSDNVSVRSLCMLTLWR